MTDIEQLLTDLEQQAKEKIKGLPMPKKPAELDDIVLPSELATLDDNKVDDLFNQFTAVVQYMHFCEELFESELEIAQYKKQLEMDIKISQATEERKDIMMAKIANDENLKRWDEVISTLKIKCRLSKGLLRGYKVAIKRIQSETISRASLRRHGILG
jgi:hypothetical protein